VLADQLEAMERSARSVDGSPDLSFLVDGLRSEREQGITIDVAYRYFATPTRSFILADTPGHVEYTRNTVTGASTARLGVLLIDARNGLVEQTRRHSVVLALLRVPHVVLAVNKIDLVDFDRGVFDRIATEFTRLTSALGYSEGAVRCVPVSAKWGDNVVTRSERTPWYDGPTLLEHLESVPSAPDPTGVGFRFPVQAVITADSARSPAYRGYAGLVAAGVVRVGDDVVVLPDGGRTTVAGIDTFDGPLDQAAAGDSVVLRLGQHAELGRGALIAAPERAPTPRHTIEATVAWLHDTPLRADTELLVRHGTRTTPGSVTSVTHRLDTQTLALEQDPGDLRINDIGQITLRVDDPLPVDDYDTVAPTGSFLLIEPESGDTLATGLVGRPLVTSPLPTGAGS
jgi:sulfate adenylyltransferase subunit 1